MFAEPIIPTFMQEEKNEPFESEGQAEPLSADVSGWRGEFRRDEAVQPIDLDIVE